MKRIYKGLLCVCFLMVLQLGILTTVKAADNIPMLVDATQIGKNQLQITYDKIPDQMKATTTSNYWVQSLKDVRPKGIASLGKNDTIGPQNALTTNMVTINMVEGNPTQYVLTFKDKITTGTEYKLIICYITVPDGGEYTGDNGSATFIGK